MPQDNVLISWSFPEFHKHEHSKLWYLIVFGVSVLLIIFAIFTANWLFALIIIMIDAILMIMERKEPLDIEFTINEKGIEVGGRFVSHKEINNFWIIYEPPEIKNVYFEFKSKVKPRLTIPLDNINPLKVRQILLERLTEDLSKENEPTSEALGRMLKI